MRRWLTSNRNETEFNCRDVGMATTADTTDLTMTDGPGPADDEIEAFGRSSVLEDPEFATYDRYPSLWNASAGFLYRAVVRAEAPDRPEYVTVALPRSGFTELRVAITEWNVLWEAAQFRRRLFDEGELPAQLRKVADSGDVNVVFVPRTRTRYYEYAPLFHLLSRATADRHGLPLLRCGQWPFFADLEDIDRYLPADFENRLSSAWSDVVWRHLMPGSAMSGFSRSDPIRLLAHNLDFWLPPVTEVMQDVLRGLPVVDNGIVEGPAPLIDGTFLDGALLTNPRMGSDLWRGEDQAAEIVAQTVEQADANGRLRGILEAVRSNRVEDDFSKRWTYAREDFERKLYCKRSKVKVRFVELTDTVPVQGPETEVIGQLVVADFMALLDERERQIVVLLNSGVTKLTDVASIMGYSSHSPVSKRLKHIREQAVRFFNEP